MVPHSTFIEPLVRGEFFVFDGTSQIVTSIAKFVDGHDLIVDDARRIDWLHLPWPKSVVDSSALSVPRKRTQPEELTKLLSSLDKIAEAIGSSDAPFSLLADRETLFKRLLDARANALAAAYSASDVDRRRESLTTDVQVLIDGCPVFIDTTGQPSSPLVKNLRSMLDGDSGQLAIKYDAMGAITGRISVMPGSFNVMSIPHDGPARSMVRSRFHGGRIVSFDFDAADTRTIVGLAGMAGVYGYAPDFHSRTAQVVFGMEEVSSDHRKIVKALFHAYAYGSSPATCASATGLPYSAVSDAFKIMETNARWIVELRDKIHARATGGVLEGPAWTVRVERDAHPGRSMALYVQAGSTSAFKAALIAAVPQMARERCEFMFPVHDEMLFDVPPEVSDEAITAAAEAAEDAAESIVACPQKIKIKSGASYAEVSK